MRALSDNRKFRVYLVNAGNDGGMASIANDTCFPALGVLELGTWLKHRLPDIEVICRDGQVMHTDEVVKEIAELKPDLVGTSVLCTSYQNSLAIAEAAKNAGAKVVLGNDQASQLGPEILKNRPYVDYIIGAEYGEEPLEQLIRSLRGEPISPEQIPTLTYRDADGTITGFEYNRDKHKLSILQSFTVALGGLKPKRITGLDILPLIDWNLYPQNHWDTYRQNFTEKFSPLIDGEITGIVTMNRARGCSRTKDDIKCGHCDMLLDIAFSSPEVFWAEVRNAHEKTGANVFYEACDSFSSFPSLIRGIVAAKPTDLGFTPHFFVYCQAVDIVKNPDLARQLKEMGVFRANVGLESGCDVTLKSMKGVHDSVETNYKALQLLREHNLHVYGSFVLGTALETPETLNETVQWVKKIISEGLIDDVEAQPILPLPHNVYGKKLIADAGVGGNPFRGTEHTDWPFNTDVIATHYINNYSGVSYEQVIAAATTIRQTAQRAGVQFGSGVSHSDLYSPADVVDLVPADREGKANSHLAHIRPPQAGATFDIS